MPVQQSVGQEEDGSTAFESEFNNQLPHSGPDLTIRSKLVISDPQYWRSYLLSHIPANSQRLDDILVGSESAAYRLTINDQEAVQLFFLKGNTFITLTAVGSGQDQAVDLIRSLGEKLAARIPDSLPVPTAERFGSLGVDEDYRKKMLADLAVGQKSSSGQLDPVLDLSRGHTRICYSLSALQAPRKYTTAVLIHPDNITVHKTDHFNPGSAQYSGCEDFYALPGEYTFAIWYEDRLIYTTRFSIR